jgi:hypothetical protein
MLSIRRFEATPVSFSIRVIEAIHLSSPSSFLAVESPGVERRPFFASVYCSRMKMLELLTSLAW